MKPFFAFVFIWVTFFTTAGTTEVSTGASNIRTSTVLPVDASSSTSRPEIPRNEHVQSCFNTPANAEMKEADFAWTLQGLAKIMRKLGDQFGHSGLQYKLENVTLPELELSDPWEIRLQTSNGNGKGQEFGALQILQVILSHNSTQDHTLTPQLFLKVGNHVILAGNMERKTLQVRNELKSQPVNAKLPKNKVKSVKPHPAAASPPYYSHVFVFNISPHELQTILIPTNTAAENNLDLIFKIGVLEIETPGTGLSTNVPTSCTVTGFNSISANFEQPQREEAGYGGVSGPNYKGRKFSYGTPRPV